MKIGIIGAGVAGLTAAYDLSRAGHNVTVYESAPFIGVESVRAFVDSTGRRTETPV